MQLQLTTPELEEWRPVVGWEGWYEVSSLGRARRVKDPHGARGGILKPKISGHGYPNVNLSRNAVVTCHMVHTMVCEAFHGLPPESYEPHHKNGKRLDARSDNLEWIPRRDNRKEPFESGRWKAKRPHHGIHSPTAKLTDEKALEIRARKGENARALAAEYAVSRYTVYDIWNRVIWKHV